MPSSQQSLRLTSNYRDRLSALRSQTAARLRAGWVVSTDNFDRGYAAWLALAVPTLAGAQRAGVTLTSAYLRAYLSAEKREPTELALDPEPYTGRDRFGRDLTRALTPPLMTAKMAVRSGHSPQQAVAMALNRALRIADDAAGHSPRQALADQIRDRDDIAGWRRLTRGTCAACISVAGQLRDAALQFEVHPSCGCVASPVVAGAPETFLLPTAAELFNAYSQKEQDEAFGSERAKAIREGVPFERLVERQPLALGGVLLTERPVEDL